MTKEEACAGVDVAKNTRADMIKCRDNETEFSVGDADFHRDAAAQELDFSV